MSHQILDIRCPGCGAGVSTSDAACPYCKRPVVISTFNSVANMTFPEIQQYAGAYRQALQEHPDDFQLNRLRQPQEFKRRFGVFITGSKGAIALIQFRQQITKTLSVFALNIRSLRVAVF